MDNQIIVKINLGDLKHGVYIFVKENEAPVYEEATSENLLSVIAMAAAKYNNIKKIKISGAKSYCLGIKNKLTEKLNTCFGKDNCFVIELYEIFN